MRLNEVKVSLKKMRFHAYHGLLPQERTVGNDYEVDLDLTIAEYDEAVVSDDIYGTVDYSAVYKTVEKVMDNPQKLIERVGYRILEAVFSDFPKVNKVTVVVSKIAPPIEGQCRCACVSLTAER